MRKKWLSILLAVTMLIAFLLPSAASAAPSKEQTIHVVQRGEMLSAIALRYGVNMWTLARVNGITNPSRIYVGQRLVIPCPQTAGRVHVVQRGENLTWIALRYGVNVWTLARVNGITNLNHIYVGQRLTIPGAPPAPAAPAPARPAPPAPAPPAPASRPEPYPTDGWLGQYFNNTDLMGAPVFTERVPWIGAEWDTGSPDPAVRSDYFSARWTTRMYLNQDHYRFCAMSDDGARIWVDRQLVLDEWHPNNGVAYCDIFYATHGLHNVRVEYYEDGGDALIYVWWEPE